MKLTVAGRDRTEDLALDVVCEADMLASGRKAIEFPPLDQSALFLGTASGRSDFINKLLRLIWFRAGVDTSPFHIPRKPGPFGVVAAWIRALLWKLLRHQHDRITLQQEGINTQITAALEFIREEQQEEVEELRGRIRDLELQMADDREQVVLEADTPAES